jgi:hypothetical protein
VQRIWPWLIAFELTVTYNARIRWPLLRGEVVVADRYLLSALVELGARLQKADINRSLPGRLLVALTPRAQHTFWCDIPAAEAFVRKGGDESVAFLARQAAIAQGIGEALGATRVDALMPLDSLGDRIVTEVIGGYEDRHRTLLNGLFWANPRTLHAAWRGVQTVQPVEGP